MSGELYFSEMMGSGVAFLDYDGDGDQDLYLIQGNMLGGKDVSAAVFPPPGPLPLSDRLYRNDRVDVGAGSSRFVDVTAAAGLAARGYGMGVATADVDGDGRVDLYLTNAGADQLWRNNGDGTFRDDTAAMGLGDRGWGVAAAFLDYDRDGWADLYVGRYVDYRTAVHKQCVSPTGLIDYCSPLSYEQTADRLYRNREGHGFEEVSQRSGLGALKGSGLGAVVCDLDQNGWSDLYVANDQMPNRLWLNRGDGTFFDEALMSGSAVNEEGHPEASMGVVVGDLDGDGVEDLFISHLARETNTFYRGLGGALFEDATRDSGLGAPSFKNTGFGVALFDFDLDGGLDLFVGNGAVKQIEPLARAGDPYPLSEPNQLYRNVGGGRFVEVLAGTAPILENRSEVTRGVAVGDLDNDGDPDLALNNNVGPARLLENRTTDARWLGLRVLDPVGADLAEARLTVTPRGGPERSIWRRTGTGGSYASARDPRVVAGLGAAAAATVEVRRPGGGRVRYDDLPADHYVTIFTPIGATP